MPKTSLKPDNINCSVYSCSSKASRERQLSFHKFPVLGANKVKILNKLGTEELVDRRNAWIKATRNNKPITSHLKVCSLHFKDEDFHSHGLQATAKRRKLKENAVPSVNLPLQSFTALSNNRVTRKPVRRVSRVQSLVDSVSESQDTIIQVEKEPRTKEVATQVNESDFMEPFVNLLDTDSKINTMTGVPSRRLLNSICTCISKIDSSKRQRMFTVLERVTLTLIKIKCNMLFAMMAILYRTTPATCKRIFVDTVSLLATVMNPLIRWPSKEEILQNMPLCFKGLESTRIVVDCTEIPIGVRKCLCCRVKTYSHYKHRHTVKFMTGVSPGGLITFISKAYGGRTSDKAIFEQSGLVEKLEPAVDAVMADKGFSIDEICQSNFIKLFRPPFLRKQKRFSPEEGRLNVKIAAARVHVERVNQRIKIFAFFKNTIPYNLLPHIDSIMIVTCGLVNLSTPILADNKFM